jgi:ABC-type Fe3+/spermidine/putrescine transport system ATPase subunit
LAQRIGLQIIMTQIELLNIHKSYPRQPAPALDGVTLTVAPTTLLALLGPSGSGKSTILKLIAGIEEPDRGDIRIDGAPILSTPAHRRGTVLMFQKAYLFPFLSVADNIAFGLRVQGARRATIAAEVGRMLDLVELPGIERKRPAQLSGGEQQRIALARALVTRPRVLLLDEPFSSLDPAVRQTLQEAVRRIQGELGITTILVTHDRGEALAMADQVALLEQGRLIAHAPPRVLFARPPTRRAARQMGVDTFLSGDVCGTTLRTALGSFTFSCPAPPAGPLTLAIRPEHLQLLDHPAANTVPAIVREQIFRGEQSEQVLSAGSVTMRVRTPGSCAYPSGTALFVRFPPEYLFPVGDD